MACATLRGKGLDKAARALSLGTVVRLGDAFGLKCLCFYSSDTRGSKASDGILALTRNSNTVKHIASSTEKHEALVNGETNCGHYFLILMC